MAAPLSSNELVSILDNKLRDLAQFVWENKAALSIQTRNARYATLGPEHQSALKSLVRKQQPKKGASKCRRQKLFELTSLVPSIELQTQINIWNANHESFFQDVAQSSPTNFYDFQASFVRVGRADATRHVTITRRRFDLESIHLRIRSLGYHDGEKWVRGGSTRLANHLKDSLSIPDGVEDIKAKLERYCEQGFGLHLWAQKLGGSGYFVVLPQTVPEGL